MDESWSRDLWILAGIVAVALFIGALLGRPGWALAGALGLYFAWNLRQLTRLHQWLRGKLSQDDLPDIEGVWGDVFDRIRRLMRETGQREDRLTAMLTRMQDAGAATPDAMVMMSAHDEIEWANPAALRLLGITLPRDAGQRMVNLLRNPAFIGYLARGNYNEALQMPSPERPDIQLTLQLFPFGSSQKLLIARDVTQLLRLEEMRRHFIANVSHELRTPITVLAGFLETLQDSKNLHDDDIRTHLKTMHDQALRMQRLVNDLLSLSKLETAPPVRQEALVDVPALLPGLAHAAELLSGERRHRITLEAAAGLKLRGNEDELRSAFSNLINNAVQYTPPGGDIKIEWHAADGGARFAVTDSGEGIAPQHLPHLTERFYRVDSARSRASGGTGLGLSIVKHVLLRHDGRLEIQSELGRGSTFSGLFPAERVTHSG